MLVDLFGLLALGSYCSARSAVVDSCHHVFLHQLPLE